MSNVVTFAPKPPEPLEGEIRLSAGTVTQSSDPQDIGRFKFFLTFVDIEGGHACVWDGATRADALAAAQEWQADGALLIDETTGGVH